MSLSEWADQYFYLSTETSAESGKWRSLPYQIEILNAMSDPDVAQVTLQKSARVGYTLCLSAAIGYFIEREPSSMLIVQPTLTDAKGFSKETIAPLFRDVPVLAALASRAVEDGSDASDTLMHRTFPGGVLSLAGANSGAGLRRVSRRVIAFDECDAYPPSAGNDGDPISLGIKRGEFFWNRKVICGSTPLVAGASRIEEMFQAGDQRRYYVPCPHCSHMDFLAFSPKTGRGHVMKWPDGKPEAAHFMCSACGCVIDETSKRAMLEAGKWCADREFKGHASFHIWSAYSVGPKSGWGTIASEFLEAKRSGAQRLRVFVNTWLGETFHEQGEAPDWERLHERRETYAIGTVPTSAIVVTGGVDVQKDRLVYELVAWGANRESWSIEAGALYGDTALDATWDQLGVLLARTFLLDDGRELPLAMLAVDSGYNTQVVYGWARRYPMSRVIACKGVSGARMLVGSPSPVDVTVRGKRMQRGYKVWPIGVDLAKGELYGWLRLRRGEGDPPAGYCHFPEYGEDYFQQLTAEHLVTTVNRRTHRAKLEWQVIPNRENHYLDARILARVAAAVLGIDRMKHADSPRPPAPKPMGSDGAPVPALPPTVAEAATSRPAEDARPGFWSGKRPRAGGGSGGWFGKRR